MFVYLDNGDLIFIEQLTLQQAAAVCARTEAQLPWAYNSAHAAALRQQLRHLREQIEWLQVQAAAQAQIDAGDQMNQDRFTDYPLGL
jgi:hypothetical protein